MSNLKTLALGNLILTLTLQSTQAGSIQSSGDGHAWAASLSHGPAALNSTPIASQENLASSGSTSGSQQGELSGLFLGVNHGVAESAGASYQPSVNLAVPSLGVVQNGSNSSSTSPTPTPLASPSNLADAFINFGSGPYPDASTLITGNPQPFFNSPAFKQFFGSTGPTPTDIANFEGEVLATIKSTYNNAGLPIALTTDPNMPAAHTMSVVSGASYVGGSGAIGITDVGYNGFSFIDKFSSAQTVDQLAIAIGHNLSHELMHAFGISNHPEQTGPYVDAASSTMQTLSDPSTSFSPVAAKLLSTLNFEAVGTSVVAGTQGIDGGQVLIPNPSPVPEPSTIALWTVAAGLGLVARRKLAA